MNKWTVLFIVLVADFALAKPYLLHHNQDINNHTIHYLSLLDAEDQSISVTKELGKSSSELSFIADLKKSDKIAVYLPRDGKHTSELVVYHKSSLAELLRFEVPNILITDNHQLAISPLFTSHNGKNIVLISNDDELSIHIYDAETGKTLLSRPLNERSSYLTTTSDKRYFYAQNLTGNGRNLTVIDLDHAETTVLTNLGNFDTNTYLHGHSLLVSSEKKTQRRPVFELFRINFIDGKKTDVELPLSEYHYVFAGNQHMETFVAGKQTKGKRDLFLSKLTDEKISQPVFQQRKIMPKSMELSKNEKVLMVLGEDKMAAISTKDLSLKSRNRLPFDVLRGIVSEDGELGIIQENSGSEIGFVNLIEGDVVKQIGAGRMGVKLGKVSPLYLLSGIAGSILDAVIDSLSSTKQLQFNYDESRLMVINEISNDITVFDTLKFKKLDAISTGSQTHFMIQFPEFRNKVLTFNDQQINVFDATEGTELLELKPASLKGFNPDKGVVFYQSGGNLKQLNLTDLSAPIDYQIQNALAVYDIN